MDDDDDMMMLLMMMLYCYEELNLRIFNLKFLRQQGLGYRFNITP